MYKTVRQGDASLQYTILPQVDQFNVNEMSITSESAGSPTKRAHNCPPLEDRFMVTARTISLTLLGVAAFILCAVGACLIDDLGRNRCPIKNFKSTAPLTNGYMKTDDSDDTKDEIQGNEDSEANIMTLTTSSSSTFKDSTVVASANKETSGLTSRISTSSSMIPEVESNNFEITMSETVSPSTSEAHTTSLSSTEAQRTWPAPTYSSLADVESSSVSDESSDSRASIISAAPTNSIVNILRKLKMMKRRRVTLKLTRITDTIPQMYLNAGIASYKKGKITTSVLSQSLTLAGIIFKTPDGTINPWQEKWPFDQDDTATLQRKWSLARDATALTLLMVLIIVVILLLMATIMLRLIRSAVVRWQNIKEIVTENRDDAQSTLLDAQSQEDPEDKE